MKNIEEDCEKESVKMLASGVPLSPPSLSTCLLTC